MSTSPEDTLPAGTLHATLVPRRATPDSAGQRAISDLARLSDVPGPGLGETLVVEEVIAHGGMGVVHAATQTAVGRKVAVKMLRPESRNAASAMQLLREAWVTGRLEHPSVVPIYQVVLDAERQPLIVLRRIEGTEWAALLDEPEQVRRWFGAGDLLEWNLRVLIQVCNAVHFAHQRGILHRDLKPENVMVGQLGEVYVLDWGIAVSLLDDGSGRLPLARDAVHVAGTPCYMAPELWAAAPDQLSVRTDVYLLGAILYRILAGKPPHEGDSLAALRASAEAEPRLPASAPEPLATLCARAMAPRPEARPPSALEFRHALEGYLERRGAELLATEAERGLERLTQLLAAERRDRNLVYGLFGACRFGFEQALARSPDASLARHGLERAVEAMVHYELAEDAPKSAAALLASLPSPSPGLRERVAAAERAHDERAAERAKLEALGRQHDDRVGRRTRLFLGVLFGTLWTVSPLVEWAIEARRPMSYSFLIGYALIMVVLVSGAGLWARDSMSRTHLNRAVMGVVLFTPLTQLLLALGNRALGVPAALTLQQLLLIWCVISTVSALTVERRLLWSGAIYAIGWLVAASAPRLVHPMMSLGNLSLTVVLLLAWRQRSAPAST
jgi:serine/threonine protein kinase